MTEEDARKKWCPFVRHTRDDDGNFHTTNGQISSGFQTCIASDCACWVWDGPEIAAISKERVEFIGDRQGHCGLIK
jgi:hypothetical protein